MATEGTIVDGDGADEDEAGFGGVGDGAADHGDAGASDLGVGGGITTGEGVLMSVFFFLSSTTWTMIRAPSRHCSSSALMK